MSEADKFVISRRRKKYKFARFDEFDNCFQGKDLSSDFFDNFSGKWQKYILEVGAGSARFSLELARRHPENFYIAVDIKSDRLYQSARISQEENITNIIFIRSEVLFLSEIFPEHNLDEIWITFPDPYANEDQSELNKRGARKRLTAERYLELYRKLLKSGGAVNFKTDNKPLFIWSKEQFEAGRWNIVEESLDLHSSDYSDDAKITTSYEERFLAEGRKTYYLRATS